MNISDPKFGLSFEVFPPRSLGASFRLWNTIEALATLAPSFVSVTYGAGGSTRDVSKAAVEVISKEYGLDVAGHLTCVDASRRDVMDVAQQYLKAGANRVVALRGDPPSGNNTFIPQADGFDGSLELIGALAELNAFEISVAAYPHKHPEAASFQSDIKMLKAKFDAGADNAITQFFFEAEDFLRFRDACSKAGVQGKIIPGILPVENWSKTKKFAERCGTPTPTWLDKAYSNANGSEEQNLLSIAVCSELCDDLMNEGVKDLHFYTLNDPNLTKQVCHALGRRSEPSKLRIAS